MKYLSLTNIQHFLDKIKTFVLDKINASPDPMHYVGTWNAAENHPELAQTDMAKAGYVYRVTVAGEQFGIAFKPGDRLVYDERGRAEKWDTTDEVWSVNGKTGDVVLPEGIIDLGTITSFDDITGPGAYRYDRTAEDGAAAEGILLVTKWDSDTFGYQLHQYRFENGAMEIRQGESPVTGRYVWGGWTDISEGRIADLGNASLDEATSPGVYRYTTVGAGKANEYAILLVAYKSGGNSATSLVTQTRFTTGGTQTRTGSIARGVTTWEEWQETGGAASVPALPTISVYMEKDIKNGGDNGLYVVHGTLSPELMALNPTLELCRMKRTGNSAGKNSGSSGYIPKRKKKWCRLDVSREETSTTSEPCKWFPLDDRGVNLQCPVNTDGNYSTLFTSFISGAGSTTSCKDIARFIVRQRDAGGGNTVFWIPSEKNPSSIKISGLVGKRFIKGKIGIRLRVDNPAFKEETGWDQYKGVKKFIYSNVCPLLVTARVSEGTDGYSVSCFMSPTYG